MAITKNRLSKAEEIATPNHGNIIGFVVLNSEDQAAAYHANPAEYENPEGLKYSTRFVIDLSAGSDGSNHERVIAAQKQHVINPITHEVRETIGYEPATEPQAILSDVEKETEERIKAECFSKINSNIVSYGLYKRAEPFKSVQAMQSSPAAYFAFMELLESKMQDAHDRANHTAFISKHHN